MRNSDWFKYIALCGLTLAACLVLYGVAGAHVSAPGGLPDSAPWSRLFLFVLIGSMSSFGWSRFVPESIGHDTERVNQGEGPDVRQPLGKYIPDDIFRFCVAMSSVELPSVVSPGPHVLMLAKGSDLLGVRSGWAGIFDLQAGNVRRVAKQDGAEPTPDEQVTRIALDDIPELTDWLQTGEPVIVATDSRKSPASKEYFGDDQNGIGLLLPLRAGTEIVGFHYWLGIQNAAMVENPRVIALASAASVLAGRLSSLQRKEKLTGASRELEVSRAMGQFAGAESWNKELPARLLKTIGELCRIEHATLWLSDSRGKQLRSVADLPAGMLPTGERSRVLTVGKDGICGHAAASGEPIWVADVAQDDRYLVHLDEVKAEYAVPLTRNGHLLGLLAVQATEVDGISAAERAQIRAVASHATEVLEYYNTYYGSQCELRRLSALSEIGEVALTVQDSATLLDEVVKIIADHFGYPHVYIFLQQGDKDFMTLRAKACRDEPALPLHFRAPLGRGMVGFAGRTATTLLANDVRKESLYFPKLAQIGAELCIPIVDGDCLVGVIDLMDRRKGGFLLDDMSMLESVAELLASSMKRLTSQSSADTERTRANELERVLAAVLNAVAPGDILRTLLADIQQSWEIHTACLLTHTQGAEGFCVTEVATAAGDEPSLSVGTTLAADDTRIQQVIETGSPIVLPALDAASADTTHGMADLRYASRGLRGIAIMPIVRGGDRDILLMLTTSKPGILRDDITTAVAPWLNYAGVGIQREGDAAATNNVKDFAPGNISELLGEILGRVQTLLMRISGESPGDEDFRSMLRDMEKSTAKAYEFLQSLPTPHAKTETAAKPVDPDPAPVIPIQPKQTSPPATGTQKGARCILVVDDQENILDVVVDILTAENHRVDTAATASEAIAKIQSSRYDIVFSDWSLDGGDARPVIEAAAKAGWPVVVTTGWRGEVDENSVHELGAKAVLRKPFDVKKLLEAVYIYGLSPSGVPHHD